MFFRLTLLSALFFLPCICAAQRYMPDFPDEDAQKLFDRAEKAYVNGKHERSAKVYEYLMKEHGETYELLFNRITSLVHTTDTVALEDSFRRLLSSPFHDCNFLSLNEDFRQIKYRPVFNLWRQAVADCLGKQQAEEDKISMPGVRSNLLWMKFQNVSSDIKVVHKIRYGAYPEISYDSLRQFRAKIYQDQFDHLLAIVQENGWLGKSKVGEDGAEAAWLIAQHGTHAPIEQVKLLPILLAAVNEGEAEMRHYAHLFDLVCSHHRRPQRYGTLRWENPESGLWELYPLEDSTGVNLFRKEAGLEKLEGF